MKNFRALETSNNLDSRRWVPPILEYFAADLMVPHPGLWEALLAQTGNPKIGGTQRRESRLLEVSSARKKSIFIFYITFFI